MQHNETELVVLPCNLMDIADPVHYTIALEIMKLAILKSFEGSPLSISKIRDKYVNSWDKYWEKTYGVPAESSTGPYWVGPRTAISVANKIITFLNEYEITVPIQPFSYVIGSLVVEGTSCIVKKKVFSKKDKSYFTVIFQQEVNEESVKPDITAITKWYYVESLYGGVIPNGILYVPLLKGKIKQEFIKNVSLAKEWIVNAFKTKLNIYPVSGPHCKNCKSKKCEEVLNAGQNEDRRIRWLRKISTRR